MPISILLAIFIRKNTGIFKKLYIFNNHNFEEFNSDPLHIHSCYS